MDRLISLQAAIDALGDEPEVWTGKDEYAMGLNNQWHYDRNAIKAVPSAQPEQQWIPCSEHPDTDRNVFIARGKTDFLSCCIGHYDHNAKLWYEDRNWFAKIMYDAMYWCEMPPLPEPWRGEEHGATL